MTDEVGSLATLPKGGHAPFVESVPSVVRNDRLFDHLGNRDLPHLVDSLTGFGL
jgi:hypothetical protein